MKIAFLSTYDFAIPGGVKNHICDLAKELTNQGNQVYIIAPSSQPATCSQIENFIQIADFPRSKRRLIPPHILFNLGAIIRLKKILNSEAFDILHIHEPLIPTLCLAALFHKKTPLFATFHTYYEKGQPLYRSFQPILNRWLKQLRGRIAVSSPAKTYIEQYFPYDYKVIPNGINLDRFSSKNNATLTPLTPGYINILFIGHAQFKRKGLLYMLEAFHLLKKDYPWLRLIIAGAVWPGRAQPPELKKTTELSSQDILYLGMVNEETLVSLYQTVDIFCAPSIGNESFGMVLIEAMAAGTPIIASNIKGYASVVQNEKEALLVPPKNSIALAQGIKRLIDDPTLGQTLVAHGKISVQRYVWSRLAKEITDYYVEKLEA